MMIFDIVAVCELSDTKVQKMLKLRMLFRSKKEIKNPDRLARV